MVSWRDRIIDDGTDVDRWELGRDAYIGASDAASFAKLSSVEKYVAAKFRPWSFAGNEFTALGHEWEPVMLAYAGITANTATIAHPTIEGGAATPDGILERSDGRLELAECKVKVGRLVTGPSLAEKRQVCAQFMCVPEAAVIRWMAMTLVQNEHGVYVPTSAQPEPLVVEFRPDDPEILTITEALLPIYREVIAAYRAARQHEKEHPL